MGRIPAHAMGQNIIHPAPLLIAVEGTHVGGEDEHAAILRRALRRDHHIRQVHGVDCIRIPEEAGLHLTI